VTCLTTQATTLQEPSLLNVHGTAVALGHVACLLRGPSGVGKSDLALRFLATTCVFDGGLSRCLVADDRVIIERNLDHSSSSVLQVSCPTTLFGKLEVRGLGIISTLPTRPTAQLRLIIDLVEPALVPRMPDVEVEAILGVEVPLLRLTPFEASAPIKLTLALALAQALALALARSS
jgi:HPr kinase/phosphorylase